MHEQKCPLDEEIDADDAGSWHWVVYVEGDGKGGKEGKGEGGDDGGDKGKWLPAATIRLVPARAGHGDGGVEEEKGGEEREKEKEKEKEPSQDKAATASSTTPAPLIPQEPQMQNSALWDGKEPYARIGRLATLREYRGRGFGRVLVEEALRWAGGHGGVVERGVREGSGGGEARRGSGEGDEHGEGLVWKGLVLAHAQAGVEGWYRDLGWRTDVGMGRWDEVGIEHVGMWRRVVVGG